MSDSDDVRGGERHTAALRIRLKFSDEAHFIERYAANISRGGIFVGTRTPKPVGTWLRFEFQLEGGLTIIRGEGSVAWVSPFDPAQPERPYGMGVRFDKLDEASRKVIERALEWKDKRRRAAQALAAKEEATARAKARAKPASAARPRGEVRAEDATRQLEAAEVLALSRRMDAGETAVHPALSQARRATSADAPAAPAPPSTSAASPVPSSVMDEDDVVETPAPVIELVAEPGEVDEDLPPLPPAPPPRRAPATPPRPPRSRTSPPPVPSESSESASEPASSEAGQAQEPQPLPLPPPPLDEVKRPAAAAAPNRVLGRVALVPGRRTRKAEVAPAVEEVRKPPRPEPVAPEPAGALDALEALMAEAGLTAQAVDEAARRARTRTVALVEKLAGSEGELDWLLEPPRPEPVPTPAQARALLDRWLQSGDERQA